jgi:hypothetical protein
MSHLSEVRSPARQIPTQQFAFQYRSGNGKACALRENFQVLIPASGNTHHLSKRGSLFSYDVSQLFDNRVPALATPTHRLIDDHFEHFDTFPPSELEAKHNFCLHAAVKVDMCSESLGAHLSACPLVRDVVVIDLPLTSIAPNRAPSVWGARRQ